MPTLEESLVKALAARRESKSVEFKDGMDVTKNGEWCEVIKDIVAIANSGGGCILLGIANNGNATAWERSAFLAVDPAQLTDRLARYVGVQFHDFELRAVQRGGSDIAALVVGGNSVPMVFVNPGTYESAPGQQKTAFGRGTIYFRHGAKSEPAKPEDLRDFVDRHVDDVRQSWLGNIRKVVEAPKGHRVTVLPAEVVATADPGATPIRITTDPEAPAYRTLHPDTTHPNREKEVVQKVNERLAGRARITGPQVRYVRKVFNVDDSKPDFFCRLRFSSPQYSDAFVDWMVTEFERDPLFFEKAKEAART